MFSSSSSPSSAAAAAAAAAANGSSGAAAAATTSSSSSLPYEVRNGIVLTRATSLKTWRHDLRNPIPSSQGAGTSVLRPPAPPLASPGTSPMSLTYEIEAQKYGVNVELADKIALWFDLFLFFHFLKFSFIFC